MTAETDILTSLETAVGALFGEDFADEVGGDIQSCLAGIDVLVASGARSIAQGDNGQSALTGSARTASVDGAAPDITDLIADHDLAFLAGDIFDLTALFDTAPAEGGMRDLLHAASGAEQTDKAGTGVGLEIGSVVTTAGGPLTILYDDDAKGWTATL